MYKILPMDSLWGRFGRIGNFTVLPNCNKYKQRDGAVAAQSAPTFVSFFVSGTTCPVAKS